MKIQNVADAAFDKLYDYPRDRYSRDRKDTQEVTILEFELTPKEADELVGYFPQPPTTKSKTITSSVPPGTTSITGNRTLGSERNATRSPTLNSVATDTAGDAELVACSLMGLGLQDQIAPGFEPDDEVRAVLPHHAAKDIQHFKAEVIVLHPEFDLGVVVKLEGL